MDFLKGMKDTLDDSYNYSTTENGALGYSTTGKALLDLNFSVSTLRNASEQKIIDDFTKAFYENKELAMKWLFFVRDVREGLGERRIFRVLIRELSFTHPKMIKNLIKYIPEYGRWDDLLSLIDTYDKEKRFKLDKSCMDEVFNIIKKQFSSDIDGMKNKKSISLMGKWLPSENASSEKTKMLAKKIYKGLGISARSYRKILSKMRRYIDVVETKMSKSEWSDINYENVPSKANLIYKEAFMRHDNVRRNDYLDALDRGEAKINSSVSYPYEIIHRYGFDHGRRSYDSTLEGMWKSLPNTIDDCDSGGTLVVNDNSGSMYFENVGKTKITPACVSTSLAIYFSEKLSGAYKNKYITFSARPEIVDLTSCGTLAEKLSLAYTHNDCTNTNIEAVFGLILKTAIDNNCSQLDMPSNILIVSDMEFDQGTCGCGQRLFDMINEKFNYYGYKMPKLIFWNVASRTETIPVKENHLGVVLVSGFSPNIAKMIMSGETDPYKILVDQLMSKRYEKIVV